MCTLITHEWTKYFVSICKYFSFGNYEITVLLFVRVMTAFSNYLAVTTRPVTMNNHLSKHCITNFLHIDLYQLRALSTELPNWYLLQNCSTLLFSPQEKFGSSGLMLLNQAGEWIILVATVEMATTLQLMLNHVTFTMEAIQMNRTVRSPSSQRDLDDTPRKRQSVISPTLLLNITKFVNTEKTPEAFDLLRLSYQTDDTL